MIWQDMYAADQAGFLKHLKILFSVMKFFCRRLCIIQDSKNLYHQNYDNDHVACVRLIDWKRGAPYVFTSNDYLELTNNQLCFARKFNCEVDKKIIDLMAEKFG